MQVLAIGRDCESMVDKQAVRQYQTRDKLIAIPATDLSAVVCYCALRDSGEKLTEYVEVVLSLDADFVLGLRYREIPEACDLICETSER
jgi:hypothetical protein